MSRFKIKPNKKRNTKKTVDVKNVTLDKKYNEKIRSIDENNNKLESLIKEKNRIENKINILENKNDKYEKDNIKKRANLKTKLKEVKFNIQQIENNYDELDYYNKAGDLICEYYNILDKNEHDFEQRDDSKSILHYLSSKNKSTEKKTKKKKNNRAYLLDRYYQRVEGCRIKKDDGKNRIKYCSDCNVEKKLIYSSSSYVCPNCGEVEEIILDEDRQIKDYSAYKRSNHFIEWLNQFQGKESTDISDNIYHQILNEINRMRIKDLSVLDRKILRSILKKLRLNKYYEHIPYIIYKLNNIPPLRISRDIEKRFRYMFIQIQEPWELFKPKGRKNFLSYSYILYKFSELLELDHLLECFSLLKSHSKLNEQDHVWEKICKYLNWEFYSSFK